MSPSRRAARASFFVASLFLTTLSHRTAIAQTAIDDSNWGSVTAPVFGTDEGARNPTGPYRGAELFAGPQKFGTDYFAGVLPNGKIVKPAGVSAQVGMDPLGMALTSDGRFLVTSNDDERNQGTASLQSNINIGGYSLTVVDTATMKVVSQARCPAAFIGIQITGTGPYTVWASGGAAQNILRYTLSARGSIAAADPASIVISPITPGNTGFASHYTPGDAFRTKGVNGALPPIPTGFSRTGAQITFPAGSALSADERYLFVACNGDNSVAVIDTTTSAIVSRQPAGYFPYGVAIDGSGSRVFVSNWGMTEYRFASPHYDAAGNLTAIDPAGKNLPAKFAVPKTDTGGALPHTSSVALFSFAGGTLAPPERAVYIGKPLDDQKQVGDTHPSALAVVGSGAAETVYVARANDDSLSLIRASDGTHLSDFSLDPIRIKLRDGHHVVGAYPNALAASPDGTRVYVAEAGINDVAVLDTRNPASPQLIGRIPTGWYPTALIVSRDGSTLYVANAKGIGEDINPKLQPQPGTYPTGIESFDDSNYLFGTVEKIDLAQVKLDPHATDSLIFAMHRPRETDVVPTGGRPSPRIKHVFFILHENKSFDAMLGNQSGHFGPYASTSYANPDGTPFNSIQNTGVDLNTQALAVKFATGVNYYSDSEESDAGHDFCNSGTATDFTEKTLLVKNGRGLLVNKNMEPEDYPAGGYIYNNAARHGVSFKDYGDMIRIAGTDTGESVPTIQNDPESGLAGLPEMKDADHVTSPLTTTGDVTSPTRGLGQSYFLDLPILAILGEKNANGEPHVDRDYPGYNFNISDQRRARTFIADFNRMVAHGTLPSLMHIYQPNDHTGRVLAPNVKLLGGSPLQLIADGDVGLGMVVRHIMQSPIYYNPKTGEGSVIFVSYDDAQGSLDHIHPHRTPLLVISPYARPGYLGLKHYSSASIVKTEELLLGLPPNNLGDLLATDLRDMFQSRYNGIKASDVAFNSQIAYHPSRQGARIWSLVARLDTSAPDRDSARLGRLQRLSIDADQLSRLRRKGAVGAKAYHTAQSKLYHQALKLVSAAAPRDDD